MTKHEQTIVVVDDDAGMNQALTRLLNAAGYRTRTYSSAEALLNAGAAIEADCLIFDVHLPGLSGFELRHRLVQSGIRPPVIFITAFDEKGMRILAEQAGAAGYFAKPFSGRTLLGAITKAVHAEEPN